MIKVDIIEEAVHDENHGPGCPCFVSSSKQNEGPLPAYNLGKTNSLDTTYLLFFFIFFIITIILFLVPAVLVSLLALPLLNPVS